MSFSSIAIGQRDKETKALRTFLVYSTLGSLVLHIAVLASGIGNFLLRTPESELEKPIELTFVEPEVKETPIPEEKKPLTTNNQVATSEVIASSSSSNSPSPISPQPVPKVSTVNQITPQKIEQKIEKVEKTVTPQKITPVNPVQPQKDAPITSEQPQPTTNNTPTKITTNNQESSDNLRGVLSQFRDSRNTQATSGGGSSDTESSGNGDSKNGSNSVLGNGLGTGTSNGSGNNLGNGLGTNTNGVGLTNNSNSNDGGGNNTGKTERRKRDIAVVPTEPKIPTQIQQPQGDNNSTDDRAACSSCKVKYSESARRRKAEGRVQVAVDTDKDGNVTDVRVTSSSGDRELDEEHRRQARNWKLKPSQGGRQGVSIATEYSIAGSRRNRQVRERQQQREERERQLATSNNSEETPRRRRRNIESSNDTASSGGESRSSGLNQRIRRTEATTSGDNRRRVRSSEEGFLSNRLRRRREVTAENYQRIQPTRRKKREVNQSSDSGNRLRSVLRRSRESTPASSEGKDGN